MDVDGMTRFLDLPSCLVIDILLRLPLKALLTCRCVCKDWIRLFSDPSFIELHRAASPIHILDRFLFGEFRILKFGQVMEDKCTGNLEVKIVKFCTKLNLPSSKSTYWCINSCNGLLCLIDYSLSNNKSRFSRGKPRSVFVCNPILGEWVSISVPVRYYYNLFALALVFSAKNNQYKVLHGFDYGFEIYTLGGTRQWRSIDETLGCRPWHKPHFREDFNTFLHGSLHWTDDTHFDYRKENFICCFDVDNEKFRRLSLPRPEREDSIAPRVQLGAINSCLWAFFQTDVAEIWAMKEYGVEKSWTMMLTIGSVFIRDSPVIMAYGGGLVDPVLLFSLNEEEILIHDYGFVSYNLKRNRLRRCQTCQQQTLNVPFVAAYNPSFISLQDVAKGEQVMLSRYSALKNHASNPIEDDLEDFEFTISEG